MKTTIIICVISLLWASSMALDTLLVGDYIYPPVFAYLGGWGNTFMHSNIMDGGGMQSYLQSAMASNGFGLIQYAVDRSRTSASTGTLIIKNVNGSYRTVALPFNCSESGYPFMRVATNGQIFLCGLKIFSLGQDDTIEDVQDFITYHYAAFGPDNVLYASSLSSIGIWTNTSGSWVEESESTFMFSSQAPRFSGDSTVATPAYIPSGMGVNLWQRNGADLYWSLVEKIPLNYSESIAAINPLIWDGNDTIMAGWLASKVGFNTIKGELKIFRKVNGAWSLNKVITSADMGLTAPGGLGVGMFQLDTNTVIVHAVGDYNRTTHLRGGVAFALERISNDWVMTKKFVQQNDDAYLVGALNYDPSDGRLYFSACSSRKSDSRRTYRVCGIKYATWNRNV